jgi:hypothetical protein
MQLGLDSDGQQKYLSGRETPEAVLKKIQAFKHKTRWEGFIDEESGLWVRVRDFGSGSQHSVNSSSEERVTTLML